MVCDGLRTGGRGREASQTRAASHVCDYFGTRQNWEAAIALDCVVQKQIA